MRNALVALCLLLASGAHAAASESLPTFGAFSFAQIRARESVLKSPRATAGDVISSYHMIAQAGKNVLYGYAQTPEQAAEAGVYWAAALKSAGVQAGTPSYADGMYQIPYATADGRVIRDFLADPRQFPPKDDAGLRLNMAKMQSALAKAGLGVVAARVVNVDALLPTYSLLYLTKPSENSEHESRLRVLKPGDDIDADVFRGAGIDVVQTPQPWMMVYIGPELGYVSLAGRTEAELSAKLAKRREFLQSEGKRLIAVKTFPLDDADYKFAGAIYFFQ